MLPTPNLEWARPRARSTKNKNERKEYLRGGKRIPPTNHYLKAWPLMLTTSNKSNNPAKHHNYNSKENS